MTVKKVLPGNHRGATNTQNLIVRAHRFAEAVDRLNAIASSDSALKADTISEKTSGSGITIDGVLIKDTTMDLDGTADALILDEDGDTTISSPTDDQIDIEVGGSDLVVIDASESTFNNTIIAYKDNGTSFRLKGPQHETEGGADVQSYAGIFNLAGYDTLGSLKTRATFSGNADMDLAFQTPERLLLMATGAGGDADIVVASNQNVVFHLRTDSEVEAPNRLILDRVTTNDTGVTNTSDVNIDVNTGNLRLMSGNTTGSPILPSLTDGERDALTGEAGMIAYNETTNKLNIYNGSAWREVTDGAV